MSKIKKICFITVNYNNAKLTLEYIKSINQLEEKKLYNIKIIIVDNASSNVKESEILKEISKSNVEVLFSNENNGYFSGLNIGLERISKENFDYIIIGNNDITFDKKFIKMIEKSSYDEDTIVLCPNIKTLNNTYQNPMQKKRYSKIVKLKSKLYYLNYYFTKYFLKKLTINKENRILEWNKSQYIWIGIGACYILVNNFRNYIPKLDDRVFLWGEEALFAHQVHSIGKKVYYDKEIKLKHHESASVSKIVSKTKFELTKKSYKIYSKYL